MRATRVPPIAAVREGATLPRSRFARVHAIHRDVVVALAVLGSAYGTLADDLGTADRFSLLGVGVLALFVGVAMLSLAARASRSHASSGSRPAGSAASPDSSPRGTRSATRAGRPPTAAALMIGIALVTFVAVLAQGLRVSNSDAIERQIQADLIVTSQDGYSEFPAAVGEAVEDAGVAETVSNVRQDVAEIARLRRQPDRPRRDAIDVVYGFRWDEGSDELLAEPRRATAPSSRTTSPRTTTCPSATRFIVRSPRQPDEGVHDSRHLRGQPLLPAARLGQRLAAGIRRHSTSARATGSRW